MAWGDYEPMASAVARTYNGSLGAECPVGSRGRAPGGGQGANPLPPKLNVFLSIQCPKYGTKSPLSSVVRDKIVRDFYDYAIASYRPTYWPTQTSLHT